MISALANDPMISSQPVPKSTDEPAFPGTCILIVDDERATRRTLAGLFKHMGYQTTEASSGQEALERIARQDFDVVILDLQMPGMDGTEVLQTARPLAPDTVFIILTAYGTLDSAIVAIRQGAFDYLLKPSSVKEIVRAVQAGLAERQQRLRQEDPILLLEKALTRLRAAPQQPKIPPPAQRFIQASDIIVDTYRRLVVVRGQQVDLTPTEFDILTYLMRHQDRVIPCRELVAHIRGFDLDEREARVFMRSHIRRLRYKVEHNPHQPRLICTVRGSGYIFATENPGTAEALNLLS